MTTPYDAGGGGDRAPVDERSTRASAEAGDGWSLIRLSWEACRRLQQHDAPEMRDARDAPDGHGTLPLETPLDAASPLPWSDADVVGLLSPELAGTFRAHARTLLAGVPRHVPWVTVLVPWKEPPAIGRRNDGLVRSFLCSGSVARELLARRPGAAASDLAFHLLHALSNGIVQVDRLCVRQVGRPGESDPSAAAPQGDMHVDAAPPRSRPPAPDDEETALIMAHRGPHAYLETALRFVDAVASASVDRLTARVALDTAEIEPYCTLSMRHALLHLFAIDAAPAGPYVCRQRLIEQATEPLLLFQDSDDLSCCDRLDIQRSEMRRWQADMVGCQEIQVDEIAGCVEAFRFPLDVTAALQRDGAMASSHSHEEPLLHATVMVRRDAFMAAGGFSTDQRIANDTQFLLRAFFSLRMRNSDEFLYVRRRHTNALTVAPGTAAGCSLRRTLAAAWTADFDRIRRGELTLAQSSLLPRASAHPYVLRPIVSAMAHAGEPHAVE